jgi:hypothetical protein
MTMTLTPKTTPKLFARKQHRLAEEAKENLTDAELDEKWDREARLDDFILNETDRPAIKQRTLETTVLNVLREDYDLHHAVLLPFWSMGMVSIAANSIGGMHGPMLHEWQEFTKLLRNRLGVSIIGVNLSEYHVSRNDQARWRNRDFMKFLHRDEIDAVFVGINVEGSDPGKTLEFIRQCQDLYSVPVPRF